MPFIEFKGKSIVHSYHLTVPYRQLIPDEARSVLGEEEPASLTGNVMIHGDNLHALKALIPSFAGKIKCIYIDPPYNTGNENWVYNDNVAHPMLLEWLGQVVDKEDLTRHDKWLCMMTPRLKLLRELLRDNGVIFISIDDNEVHRLRILMDEIFGEENFIDTIIWQKKYSPQNDARFLSPMHDYIVVYAKNSEVWTRHLLPRSNKQDKAYKNLDNDLRGLWKPSDLTRAEYRERDYYSIITPSGKLVYPAKGRSWSRPPEEIERLRADNRLYFGVNGDSIPSLKRFLHEVQQGVVPVTLWTYDEVGSTDDAKKELKSIFEGESVLETIKPSGLIKRILQIATDPESIVIDSFAGSGTTGHAVLALNAEDGGNRRFILIEQEEYADTLTAERLRRVIKGVPNAKDKALQTGLGGSFTYCQLGPNFDEETLLKGGLPVYDEMARFVFFTSTGEKLDESQIDERRCYLGESTRYSVYLIYQPDIAYLKNTPLDLQFAMDLPPANGKKRLVIASHKYLDEDHMAEYAVEFCQLPFGIYRYRAD